MERKENIIVNVINANVDIETSGSLQLSREYDKEGKRTVICLTKVDQF